MAVAKKAFPVDKVEIKTKTVAMANADRLTFGFHNPNHAPALACALVPLCRGWRRAAWAGRGLSDGVTQVLVRKIVV